MDRRWQTLHPHSVTPLSVNEDEYSSIYLKSLPLLTFLEIVMVPNSLLSAEKQSDYISGEFSNIYSEQQVLKRTCGVTFGQEKKKVSVELKACCWCTKLHPALTPPGINLALHSSPSYFSSLFPLPHFFQSHLAPHR